MVQLVDDVYPLIIRYLRQPLPSPTGRNEAPAIRQNGLASVMRVSKLFNNIAAPHLYTIVASDHLPSLVYNHDRKPAASGIKSKRQLLSLIRRLFLDYCEKSTPTYVMLLSRGPIYYHLIEQDRKGRQQFCDAEAEWVGVSAEKLKGIPKCLLSLALGPFLSKQTNLWQVACPLDAPIYGKIHKDIERSRLALTALIVQEDRAGTFCQHTELGPLDYSACLFTSSNDPTPAKKNAKFLEHRRHTEKSPPRYVEPAILGGHSIWYCDFEDSEPTFEAFVYHLSLAMGNQVGDRQTHWEKYTRPSATPGERIIADQPLSIDIYLPPHFVTLHRKVNIMNQLSLPQSREKQALAGAKLDSWRLMSLDDAPTCDACFWNYEIDTPPEIKKRNMIGMKKVLAGIDSQGRAPMQVIYA